MSVAWVNRVGIDENGLGPRLGPLLVTGVLARVRPEALARVGSPAEGELSSRLGDSKALVSHGDVALGEAWARALVAKGCGQPNKPARNPAELIEALTLDTAATLRAPCPEGLEPQCWGHPAPAFEASQGLLETVRGDLDALEREGVELVGVRAVVVCTQQLNAALDAGRSRLVVDLHAMERLALAFRDLAGEELVAVCGKVGGFKRYPPLFGPLGGRLCTPLEESQGRSAYRIAGLGELSFLRDADASDRCVALASLVGKYLREALMGQIVAHYQAQQPDVPNASGYYDPTTTRFLEATRLLRHERVPADCFERRSGKPDATVSTRRAPRLP